jgi:polysaccharide biosynthesis protein PelE
MPLKTIRYILLAASALVLESVCWAPFFTSAAAHIRQIWFLVLHGMGSVAGGALMTALLPDRYRFQPWRAFFLFFGLCLFIPGLGLAGLLLAVWPGIRLERRKMADGYRRIEVPELPYKPLKVNQKPIYGQAGMISVLRHVQDPERRVKALIATRQMASQEAIPILKEALRDPVDDVRLLAYSMLDAKEEEINAAIRDLLKQLEAATSDRRRQLHERISNYYWELAYLGLAQGEVLRHSLTRALEHLEQALQTGGGEPTLYIQRGRLLMHQRRWEAARAAFTVAVDKGVPAAGVAPYLAEIAFEKKEFTQIPAYIRQVGPSIRKSERLAAVAAYWT